MAGLYITNNTSLVSVILFSLCFIQCLGYETRKWPTIGISVLARNKAHTLPYFLSCLQDLDYPKERLYIWIYSENNKDNTASILHSWTARYALLYNNIYMKADVSAKENVDDSEWNDAHFRHVINIREKALNFARKHWADYIFMIDADVFLTEKNTLKNLVSKNMSVVAPMLNTDGLYSNYWCGMSDQYYYERTDDYKLILNRKKIGCFEVPMVHTAVLINLREVSSDHLTYDPQNFQNYSGPIDDIITFAISAKVKGIKMNVCNDAEYGFVTIPQEDHIDLAQDFEQLQNIKMEALGRGTPLPLDENLAEHVQYLKPSKYSFDAIFMINLERRSERRRLMKKSFQELGIDAKLIKAIDGKKLSYEELIQKSIKLMDNYEDPYHARPMKMGEIGCFLSHHELWQEIADKGYEMSLILEDDVHFEPYFRSNLAYLLKELHNLDWDLVYIGRKILENDEEAVTERLVKPHYTYWTIGYILSKSGAEKLLKAEPLQKLLPVDEFLPIMFDQHPNETWKSHFPVRNLIALSASPLLIKPTHYTGEPGYVSDTEASDIVANEV